jgi:hypothetical protein
MIRRRYATKRWIACQLQFRGRRRERLTAPGRYTELFFLDDATALAAGHRACAECRRADYRGARRRARGNASVITPPSLLAVLAGGWDPLVPLMHPTARVVSST